MPQYTFIDIDGTTWSEQMTISERTAFLETNPGIKQELCAPAFGDSVRLGIRKIDRSFNDVLIKAKGSHKYSTINTR